MREDEDNCAVIHSARDALKLIRNKFLPAVCSWVQVRALPVWECWASRVPQAFRGCPRGKGRAPACLCDVPPRWQLFTRAGVHGGHLEGAIDLKAELETALRRSQELDIEPEGVHRREVSATRRREAARGSLSDPLSKQELLGLQNIPVPFSLRTDF